jgi:hypothetical protein
MSTLTLKPRIGENARPKVVQRRSVVQSLAGLEALAARSASLLSKPLLLQSASGKPFWLPRYLFIGPKGGDDPIRIGLFAGVHGDEPEGIQALIRLLTLLEEQSEPARGYCLFVYPICNPTGFEDNTRNSRSGYDLNREFWNRSKQPEVLALQQELCTHALDGIISLHSDNTSDGVYGYARGALLTRHLIEPALRRAEELLPRNLQPNIDGFKARNGIIRDCFQGVLSAPPKIRPRPFEIILETPQAAPQYLQEMALVAALQTILGEYRKFIAYAANL